LEILISINNFRTTARWVLRRIKGENIARIAVKDLECLTFDEILNVKGVGYILAEIVMQDIRAVLSNPETLLINKSPHLKSFTEDQFGSILLSEIDAPKRWIVEQLLLSQGVPLTDKIPVAWLCALNEEDLLTVKCVGSIRAKDFIQFFATQKNLNIISHKSPNTNILFANNGVNLNSFIIDQYGSILLSEIDPSKRWLVEQLLLLQHLSLNDEIPVAWLCELNEKDFLEVKGVGSKRAKDFINYITGLKNKFEADDNLTKELIDQIAKAPNVINNSLKKVKLDLAYLDPDLRNALACFEEFHEEANPSIFSILSMEILPLVKSGNFTLGRARVVIAERNSKFCAKLVQAHLRAGVEPDVVVCAALIKVAVDAAWVFKEWRNVLDLAPEDLLCTLNKLISLSRDLDKNILFYIKDLSILNKISNGKTLSEVGREIGLTRERVRQRLRRIGISIGNLQLVNQRQEEDIRSRIEKYVIGHPGCTLQEIASKFDCSTIEAKKFAKKNYWLVLDEIEEIAVDTCTNERIRIKAIDALKNAATLTFPVTHMAYHQLIQDSLVRGPSAVRIIQLYGSWRNACDQAGVECGQGNLLPGQTALWAPQEVLNCVSRYLLDPTCRGSSQRYKQWKSSQDRPDEIPSLGTIMNVLCRPWKLARHRALINLRHNWEGQGAN